MDYENIKHCQPHLGNNVPVCDLDTAPYLRWKCDSKKLYTIFVIDVNPLGTTRPKLLAHGILWWVVNIPGCKVADGKTIFEYQSPTPLYGAGTGRYAYFAYEQPKYEIDWSDEQIVSAT